MHKPLECKPNDKSIYSKKLFCTIAGLKVVVLLIFKNIFRIKISKYTQNFMDKKEK